jgi:subtilisin family serine protease
MRLFYLFCIAFLLVDAPSFIYGQPSYAPGELIVKLRDGRSKPIGEAAQRWEELGRRFRVTRERPVMQRYPTVRQKPVRNDHLDSILLLTCDPPVNLEAAVAAYNADPSVEYAVPNYLRHPLTTPNDPRYEDQWNLQKIGWETAWGRSDHTRHPIIAIVDTGVDYTHEDLRENIWINKKEETGYAGLDDDGNGYIDDTRGWDFTDAPTLAGIGDYLDRDNDPMDESGHGTHVAGIIGAVADNGVGMVGIAPQARLMALRAGFRTSGGAFLEDDDIAAAIVYATDNGAEIVNMSWGDPRPSPLIRDVIRYAYEREVTLVAAAGNEGESKLFYPASLGETIAVGASDDGDRRASFSNFGENLDLLAPGVGILGTLLGGGYSTLSGTSMAAPHVAGVVGLLKTRHPEWSPEEIKYAILRSTTDLGPSGWDAQSGAGRLNVTQILTQDEGGASVRIIAPENGTGAPEPFAGR